MKFIEKHFKILVLAVLLILAMQMCGNKVRTTKADEKLQERIVRIDSTLTQIEVELDNIYPKEVLDVRIQIEGLKSEKRMIQATNRKMLDVQRQNDIEKEIRDLEEKIK